MTVEAKVRGILLSNARAVYQRPAPKHRCPTCGFTADEPEVALCRGECESVGVGVVAVPQETAGS